MTGTLPHHDNNPRRSRPEAPIFSFAPPPDDGSAGGDEAAGVPELEPGQLACPVCGGINPTGHRYCAVCGTTLASPTSAAPTAASLPSASQRAVPSGPPAGFPVVPSLAPAHGGFGKSDAGESEPPPTDDMSQPRSARQPPLSAGPIVATPVLSISEPAVPRATMQTCSRCKGQSDELARFCKFCGAPFGAPAVGHPPTPRAEAPAPPQRPAPTPPPRVGPGSSAPKPVPAAPRSIPTPSPAASPLMGSPIVPSADTIQTRAPDQLRTPPHAAQDSDGAAPLTLRKDPAPAARSGGRKSRMVVVVEDGSDGKVFELTGSEVVIGRTEGDVLLFDDPYVSPRHAKLIEQKGTWTLEDQGSTNGIFLRTRGRTPIEAGDLILLGSQVLQFQLVSEEERQLGPVSQHGTRVFGSKPVNRIARLDQRTTIGLVGDTYYVYRDETVLGREAGDIVFTADAFLSRKHAVIRRDPRDSAFSVEDLDSSNGTYLGIRRSVALKDGDRLRFGQHLFRFECSSVGMP